MAHRVNVTPVKESIPASREGSEQIVVDPICGKNIFRRESRFMVFRADGTHYFCSKECQEKYIHPVKKPAQKAA